MTIPRTKHNGLCIHTPYGSDRSRKELFIIKTKKFIAIGLIASQLVSTVGAVSVFADEKGAATPVLSQAKAIERGGLITIDRGKSDVDVLDNMLNAPMPISEELPTSYNSNPKDLIYVPEIRDQGLFNSCWAFASMSTLESLMMKHDKVEKTTDENKDKYDFSEVHLEYALSNKNLEDGGYGVTREALVDGGDDMFTVMYLTRERDEAKNIYNGPVAEKDFAMKYGINPTPTPYTDEEIAKNMGAKSLDFTPSSFTTMRFTDVKLTDEQIKARNELIKKAVKKNGAVSVGIYCGSGSGDFNAGFIDHTDASGNVDTVYYYNDPSYPNHAVTIVGYDDNYPCENFDDFATYLKEGSNNYPTTPSHNGAFLCRNSWGTEFAEQDGGYFYMSYDSHIDHFSYYEAPFDNSSFDNLYDKTPYSFMNAGYTGKYYDDDKRIDGIINSLCFGAQRFDKKNAGTVENITRVGTWVMNGGEYLKFYIDTDPEGKTESSDLRPVSVKPINDATVKTTANGNEYMRVDQPGYYIFELETPVKVTGDSFIVGCEYGVGNAQPNPKHEGEGDVLLVPAESGLSLQYEDGTPKNVITPRVSDDPGYLADSVEEALAGHCNKPDRDLIIKAYTEESIDITIDGQQQKADYNDTLKYSGGLLYEKTGENAYKEFDLSQPITESKTLFTAKGLGILDIKTVGYQEGTRDSDKTSVGTRIVGEVENAADRGIESAELKITAYDSEGKPAAIDGQSPYIIKELYKAIDNYTVSENSYGFVLPPAEKKDLSKIETTAEFKLSDGRTLSISYLPKGIQ